MFPPPHSTSYGVYNSKLNWVARVCSHVTDRLITAIAVICDFSTTINVERHFLLNFIADTINWFLISLSI